MLSRPLVVLLVPLSIWGCTTGYTPLWLVPPRTSSRSWVVGPPVLRLVPAPVQQFHRDSRTLLFGSKKRRIQDDDDDNDGGSRKNKKKNMMITKQKNIQQELKEERELLKTHFPPDVRPGAEMDVRIRYVHPDYALCRPVDYPNLRGKISRNEMCEFDEYEGVTDATRYEPVARSGSILRARVQTLQLPNRVGFSLRRVRRVLNDDFRPFTVAIYGLPEGNDETHLVELMEQSGPVLHVESSSSSSTSRFGRRPDPVTFVTFLHKEHALAAMRKWNKTKMPCAIDDEYLPIGDEDEHADDVVLSPDRRDSNLYPVRCQKSTRRPSYRDVLQYYLDEQLKEKMERWDETPHERRCRGWADQALDEILPWRQSDRMSNEHFYDEIREKQSTPYRYSVKNTVPRRYVPVDDDVHKSERSLVVEDESSSTT